MDIWRIKNSINNGEINYKIGDIVVLFRRKGKNPRRLEYNTEYVVKEVIGDYLNIEIDSLLFKVHKTYMIQKSYIRDIKISRLISKIY